MSKFAFLFIPLLLATAVSAQQLGERTATPESMLSDLRGLAPDAGLEAQIAAAEAYPIGSAENPVRVGGPEGERAYLARLRCPNSTVPRIGAREEAGTSASGTVVASYAVTCPGGTGAPIRIIFDMYHAEHDERRAPEGLSLARP